MVRNLLIRIESDPRKSGRPAEAVRIAAGVGAWNKVKVDVAFVGPGVLCLDEFADELQQGELFTQYLPSVVSHGGRILVEESNRELKGIKAKLNFETVSESELDKIQREVDHMMRF